MKIRSQHRVLRRRGVWRASQVCFVFPWIVLFSQAQTVGNSCGNGTGCVVQNATFVNVYWENDLTTYDQDIAAEAPVPSFEAIDEFVAVLLHTTYTSALSQYGVVSATFQPPSFAGTAACTPTNRSVLDLFNNPSDVDKAIQCVLQLHPSLTQVPGQLAINFVLPPQPNDLSDCQTIASEVNGHGVAGGWHNETSKPYTIVPLGCSPSLIGVEAALSHEIDEMLTDPIVGSGWTNSNNGQEIADECENVGLTFILPQLTSSSGSSGTAGVVSQYWSNQANGCVSSLTPNPPQLTSETICGSGPYMKITLNGVFPAFPSWDMTSNAFSGQTPYIAVEVLPAATGIPWWAGLPVSIPLNPAIPPVSFGSFSATSSQITIYGFSTQYGTMLSGQPQNAPPGSTINTFVVDPNSGAAASITQIVPNPQTVLGFDVVPASGGDLFVNGEAEVNGALMANGCQFAATPLNLSASSGVFPNSTPANQSSIMLTTNTYGDFSSGYTAPSTARNVLFQAQQPQQSALATLTVPVYPDVSTINPAIGPVAGGQTVTIHGNGFATDVSPVNVAFDGAVPTAIGSVNITSFSLQTPHSPLSGDGTGIASVAVTVNGVQSLQTLTYEYIVPFQPVLTFQQNGCGPGSLTVTGYDMNGNAIASSDTNYEIVLTAPTNQIEGPNGKTNSITIPSGQTVQVIAGGPFTAMGMTRSSSTGAWQMVAAAVTKTFPYLSLGWEICDTGQYGPVLGPHGSTWINGIYATYGSNAGQVAGVVLPNYGCDFCGSQQNPFVWGSDQGVTFTLVANSERAKQVGVQVLDLAASRRLANESPVLLLAKPAGVQFRTLVVQITEDRKLEGELAGESRLGIALNGLKITSGTHLELYHRIRAGQGYLWSKEGIKYQKATAAAVWATVRERGYYAVVEVVEGHDWNSSK
jgi:hypothetical protein